MYASIDREALTVLHVHPVLDMVSGLLYLEGTKIPHAMVVNTLKPYFLADLTTLELNHLYRNSTGCEFPDYLDDLARRQAIAHTIEGMTPKAVLEAELDAQISFAGPILETAESPDYRYVLGSKRPALNEGGLFPITLGTPRTEIQLQAAATLAPQRLMVRQAPSEPELVQSAPRRAPVARSSVPGGSRPAIFAHADKVWEEAGKPMDKDVVLQLRKRMMSELEEQGIKKTTSSTALGDWMKQRLS